jgi:hypothetical protein
LKEQEQNDHEHIDEHRLVIEGDSCCIVFGTTPNEDHEPAKSNAGPIALRHALTCLIEYSRRTLRVSMRPRAPYLLVFYSGHVVGEFGQNIIGQTLWGETGVAPP